LVDPWRFRDKDSGLAGINFLAANQQYEGLILPKAIRGQARPMMDDPRIDQGGNRWSNGKKISHFFFLQ